MTAQRKIHYRALLWAGAIILVAIVCVLLGVNDGAKMGIVGGMSGAAWSALQTDSACGRECLQ